MALVTGACFGEDGPAKPDSTLEIVQFKAPAGWQATERPGQAGKIYTSPDSSGAQQAVILLAVSPAQEGLDLGVAFDAAIKDVISNGKLLESTDAVASKTRQGFEARSRTLVIQSEGGQRVYARMIAAKVQNRMAGIYYLATTQELYDQHQAEMGALLQSVNFNSAAADPKAELAALEGQKQELLKRVAEIEARQRQLLAGGDAGAAAGTAPVDGEQLLLKARAQFAKDVAARRKPHVIVGDILALDGKPIPNVAAYRVFVWGTTIAAEKTNYGLDVDQNGHFEQQVPDGLYQLKATCIVNHGGHRVPVDLVWLDDKKVGVVQGSAAGIVRDFRLVMNGLKPGEDPKGAHAYQGGVFRLNGPDYDLTRGHLSTRFPGAKVQVTMTPVGPLVDGSRGEPFTIDVDVAELNYSTDRRNIPLGTYKVSAVLTAKDGGKRALACSRSPGANFGESAEIWWESSRDDAESRGDPAIYLKD
jgi:hypothetical protein